MEKREFFKFYNSYFEVFCQLKSDKDKLKFITAVLNKEFLGQEPTDLSGMVSFAYISQKHSIDRQWQGYLDWLKKQTPEAGPDKGAKAPPDKGPEPEIQHTTDNKEKNNTQSEIIGECLPSVLPILMNWLEYKRQSKFKYKDTSLKTLVKKFNTFSNDPVGLESLVENSVMNGYTGIIWEKYVKSNTPPAGPQTGYVSQFKDEQW